MKTIQDLTEDDLKFILARLEDCRQWNEDKIFEAAHNDENDITVYEGMGYENTVIKNLVTKINKILGV